MVTCLRVRSLRRNRNAILTAMRLNATYVLVTMRCPKLVFVGKEAQDLDF